MDTPVSCAPAAFQRAARRSNAEPRAKLLNSRLASCKWNREDPEFPQIPTIHQLTEKKTATRNGNVQPKIESNEYSSSEKNTRVDYYSSSTLVLEYSWQR